MFWPVNGSRTVLTLPISMHLRTTQMERRRLTKADQANSTRNTVRLIILTPKMYKQESISVGWPPPACQPYVFRWPPIDVSTSVLLGL